MYYTIGDHNISISCDTARLRQLLPSFAPFENTKGGGKDLLFTAKVTEGNFIKPADTTFVYDTDTGNGIIRTEALSCGGYLFLMHDSRGAFCGGMQTTTDLSQFKCSLVSGYTAHSFTLNSMLMVAYAIRSALFDTLLIHASVVRRNGVAYAFTAASGTGKSTHVANWIKALPGCDIVNDDNPIVRIIDGKAVVYGSPWSGKTPCYRNIRVPLGGVMQIKRATTDFAETLHPVAAFSVLLNGCSSMKWDNRSYRSLCNCVKKIVESVTVGAINCTADTHSAVVCSQYLER